MDMRKTYQENKTKIKYIKTGDMCDPAQTS